jgi:predicted DNA-binding transcriptional regulator AlpA
MPTDDLLHRVDVRRISTDIQQQLLDIAKQAVREVLAEQRPQKPRAPVGALRAKAAAAYIGISRTRFYELLDKDPSLAASAFPVGKKARAWPTAALDRWMQAQGQPQIATEAA